MTTFTREQGWAAVLTLWHANKLPTPKSIDFAGHSVSITLASLGAVLTWVEATNATEISRRVPMREGASLYTWFSGTLEGIALEGIALEGIALELRAHEDPALIDAPDSAELDASLAAAIATLAEPVVSQ